MAPRDKNQNESNNASSSRLPEARRRRVQRGRRGATPAGPRVVQRRRGTHPQGHQRSIRGLPPPISGKETPPPEI